MSSGLRTWSLVAGAVLAAAAAAGAALWMGQRPPRERAEPQGTPSAVAAQAVSMHFDDPHASSLPVEMAGLGAARFHLESGHPELALQQLEKLRARVPLGGLRTERTAELAIVLCALGKDAEAGNALRDLAHLSPPAELMQRAEGACNRR